MFGKKIKRREGITLIELIMVIVVVGVLATGLSFGIKEAVDLYQFLTFHNEISSQGEIALMRMGREIRQADTIEEALTDSLQFLDINGARLRFRHTDNNLWRDVDSDLDSIFEAQNILATDVSQLDFSYYNKDNNQLSEPVSDPSEIYRIVIELTLSRGSQTLTLRSQVWPRNL